MNGSLNGSSPSPSTGTGDRRSDRRGKLRGFGDYSRHTFKIERLSEDRPVIIELVDMADKIDLFLSYLVYGTPIQCGLLATTEPVQT